MQGIFQEFDNENALRQYPFAAGCVQAENLGDRMPAGVFVDAALYPVNSSGPLYLSSVSAKGVFGISDDTGVIMTGSASGSVVEMYDASGLNRHVGRLIALSAEALEEFLAIGEDREFEASQTTFAASCVVPVTIDGVVTLNVGETGRVAKSLAFTNGNADEVRACSDPVKNTLRFDVLVRPGPGAGSIRRIICVVDGKTPFRIAKSEVSYNSVMLTLDGIDKETVCAGVHRENAYEMADTCDCEKIPGRRIEPPDVYQLEEVFIPPTQENPRGAENAFYLIAPNLLNYSNPISITLEEGVLTPRVSDPKTELDGYQANLKEGENLDMVTSNVVTVQVPGLNGGQS